MKGKTMKICPLITQVSILEEPDNIILLGESDGSDLHDDPSDELEVDEEMDGDEDIFMNPESDGSPEKDSNEESCENDEEETEAGSEEDPVVEAVEKPVRYVARSTRGEIRCLGSQCRFHNDESNECGIEMLLRTGSEPDEGRAQEAREAEEKLDETLGSIRGELEKSWDFQQRSTGDILGLFKELEIKTIESAGAMRASFENSLDELKEMITSVNEDNRLIVESLSDTLAERNEDLDNRLTESSKTIESFQGEVANWKESLDESVNQIKSDLEENRRLAQEVSQNNNEIMEVVENQKKALEEEDIRRRIAETKKLNNAGVISYHSGQFEKALDLFKKAIEMDEEFTEGYNNLGLTYTEMNEEDKATEAFKKAIELNPDLAATYNNLGYVFYRMGSYTEAIEMYNEAIGRSSDSSSAYTNLGNACYKLDRVEDAIDAWQKALDIDPSNEKAKRNLKRFHAEVK